MEGHDTPKISVIYGTNREISDCFWCPRPAAYTRMGVGFTPHLRAICGEVMRAVVRAGSMVRRGASIMLRTEQLPRPG